MKTMEYEFIRSRRKTIGISVKDDGSVILRAPLRCPRKEAEQFLYEKQDWVKKVQARIKAAGAYKPDPFTEEELKVIKQRAHRLIPPMVRDIAGEMGADYNRIFLRTQKSRWGSCSSKRNLNFNCLLVLLPEDLQRYVIVHELCHLKEMNHSKRFWAEVAKYRPCYREEKKRLNAEGHKLLLRLG